MTIYTELLLAVAADRRSELVAEADRARVLSSARRAARTSAAPRTTDGTSTPTRPVAQQPSPRHLTICHLTIRQSDSQPSDFTITAAAV